MLKLVEEGIRARTKRYNDIQHTLSHGDITPGFEHHHRNRTAWESIANDQLCNNVETDLLIGDRLDHANRDNVDKRNDQRKNEVLNRELSRPHFDRDHTEGEHAQENNKIPPFRNLWIPRH